MLTKMYLLTKKYWKKISIILIILVIIYLIPDRLINLCNTYQGIITAGIGILALGTWKNELKAKKYYELNNKAYDFLLDLQENMDYFNDLFNQYDDDAYVDRFNEEIITYFKSQLGKIKELSKTLRLVNQDNKIMDYFVKIFTDYSKRQADLHCGEIPTYHNAETGEEIEDNSYLKKFYCDYFAQKGDKQFQNFHYEFDSQITEGLTHYGNAIQKFFK